MFKNIFSTVSGFNFFPLITLVFFFTFFLAVIYFANRLDKKFINYMSKLPLENNEE